MSTNNTSSIISKVWGMYASLRDDGLMIHQYVVL